MNNPKAIRSVDTAVCYGIGREASKHNDRDHYAILTAPALDKPATAHLTTFRDSTMRVLCPYLSENGRGCTAGEAQHNDESHLEFDPCGYLPEEEKPAEEEKDEE